MKKATHPPNYTRSGNLTPECQTRAALAQWRQRGYCVWSEAIKLTHPLYCPTA